MYPGKMHGVGVGRGGAFDSFSCTTHPGVFVKMTIFAFTKCGFSILLKGKKVTQNVVITPRRCVLIKKFWRNIEYPTSAEVLCTHCYSCTGRCI